MRVAALAAMVVATSHAAHPARWSPTRAWIREALCIHRYESIDWHYGPGRTRGRPWSGFYGGMQFQLGTWRHAKRLLGTYVDIDLATPREQLHHAWAIWREDGGSWRQWPNTSRICGLS